jgi:hypothetical protein
MTSVPALRVRIPAGAPITRPAWLGPSPYRLDHTVTVTAHPDSSGRVAWGDDTFEWSAAVWEET